MTTNAHGRVISGKTWEDFCDSLKAAGQIVLDPRAPATELDRAEGWRYLSRLARIGLDMFLECADPDFPEFYSASHPTAKIGADNPDNIYHNATISGAHDYKITGTRGTVPYLSFATRANRYAIDGTMPFTGELDMTKLQVNPDGTFEVLLSQTKKLGNWLPQEKDSSVVIVRQTFLDKSKEIPAQMKIERIGGSTTPRPLSAERLDKSLGSVAAFVTGTARTFLNWAELFRGFKPNTLPAQDQAFYQKGGGDPNIHYIHGFWELKPDEALVIDATPPDCMFWNFQLDNYWMESLDYRYLPIWVNKHSATYNKDGSVTIVVAAENPGVANFITTAAHDTGTMLLRWVGAKSHPIPGCKVVKLASLRAS